MGQVKKIINSEINTKFILCHINGLIEIPDMILTIESAGGFIHIIGIDLQKERPAIMDEIKPNGTLVGFLNRDLLDRLVDYCMDDDTDATDAVKEVKWFVGRVKKILPYIRIDPSVDEFMEEYKDIK